jgi:hypothetical protein
MDQNRVVTVKNGLDCFINGLEGALTTLSDHSDFILNRHLSFLYRKELNDSVNSMVVSPFFPEEMFESIHRLDGIKFTIESVNSIEEAEKLLLSQVSKGIPTVVCVDTFFLEFFPKKNGHTIHTVVVSDVDLKQEMAYVSCSLPFQGTISLNKLRIARNVRSPSLNIQNKWVKCEIPFKKAISLSKEYVIAAFNENIVEMSKSNSPNSKVFYGIEGMVHFKDDFAYWLKNIQLQDTKTFLQNKYLELGFLVEQRKRYALFVNAAAEYLEFDIAELVVLSQRMAHKWDVFRNLCYKISLAVSNDLDKLVNYFHSIIQLERESLTLLTYYQKRFAEMNSGDKNA